MAFLALLPAMIGWSSERLLLGSLIIGPVLLARQSRRCRQVGRSILIGVLLGFAYIFAVV
jgi:hypothetical protein